MRNPALLAIPVLVAMSGCTSESAAAPYLKSACVDIQDSGILSKNGSEDFERLILLLDEKLELAKVADPVEGIKLNSFVIDLEKLQSRSEETSQQIEEIVRSGVVLGVLSGKDSEVVAEETAAKAAEIADSYRAYRAGVLMNLESSFKKSCSEWINFETTDSLNSKTDDGVLEPNADDSFGSLPLVRGDVGKEPSLTIPMANPPNRLLSKDIYIGSGGFVNETSTLRVHYVLASWKSKKIIESSWSGDPVVFPLSGVIKGWQEGLAGMREGGRRLLVVPPELGYGENGTGPIGPDETLVFVIDILNIY